MCISLIITCASHYVKCAYNCGKKMQKLKKANNCYPQKQADWYIYIYKPESFDSTQIAM